MQTTITIQSDMDSTLEHAKWSATTIIRILKDEIYTGTLIQGKQSTHNYKLKELIDKPVAEWVRVKNAHEAITRKHDFDLVQKIMRLDTQTAPHKDKVYLFSGIALLSVTRAVM